MSSPDDAPPPPRDPLLDDPEFAELVEPPKPAAPVVEPVSAPVESLPVAHVVRPKAVPVQPVKAVPVPPNVAPNVTMPVPVETDPPRPQWFAACSVIGCMGVLVIAALAALIYIAVTLLSNLGDKISETKTTAREVETVPRGALAPTILAGDIEVNLPGRVDAVARGGGGRFLLMRIPGRSEIHVFDANQAQVVYQIPLKAAGSLFTAGADKIFVCDPIERKLTAYGLFSGKSDSEVPLPKAVTTVHAVVIGSEASTPLRVIGSTNGRLRIYTVDSGALSFEKPDDFNFAIDPNLGVMARASANGSVLGVSHKNGAAAIWYGAGQPAWKDLEPSNSNNRPQWAIPSPDGQYFYSPRGVYDTGGNPHAGTRSGFYTFPTAAGSEQFLSLEESDGEVSGELRIHAAGDTSMARSTKLSKVFLSESSPANVWKKNDLTAADRIHYWPAGGLAAVLPHAREGQTSKLLLFKLPVVVK